MIALIERSRCWFVPMRPVTPFMMMPIWCVVIARERLPINHGYRWRSDDIFARLFRQSADRGTGDRRQGDRRQGTVKGGMKGSACQAHWALVFLECGGLTPL